jgi:hypothetical protein
VDLGAWVMMTGRVDCGASGLFDLDLCGVSREVLSGTAEAREGISLFELASGEVLSRTTEARIGVSLHDLAIVLSYEWPCSLAVAAFSLVES